MDAVNNGRLPGNDRSRRASGDASVTPGCGLSGARSQKSNAKTSRTCSAQRSSDTFPAKFEACARCRWKALCCARYRARFGPCGHGLFRSCLPHRSRPVPVRGCVGARRDSAHTEALKELFQEPERFRYAQPWTERVAPQRSLPVVQLTAQAISPVTYT